MCIHSTFAILQDGSSSHSVHFKLAEGRASEIYVQELAESRKEADMLKLQLEVARKEVELYKESADRSYREVSERIAAYVVCCTIAPGLLFSSRCSTIQMVGRRL